MLLHLTAVKLLVFQITFKGRLPTRSSEGSVDVGLNTISQVSHYILSGQGASFLRFWSENPLLSGTLHTRDTNVSNNEVNSL